MKISKILLQICNALNGKSTLFFWWDGVGACFTRWHSGVISFFSVTFLWWDVVAVFLLGGAIGCCTSFGGETVSVIISRW